MDQEIIAVVGETVSICFEAPDHFVGDMTVTFHVSVLEGEPNDPNRKPRWVADFTENLPATPAGVGEGSKETLVDWVVSLPDAKLSEQLCIITFDAGGTTASGRCLKARAQNRLRIPGFVVTDHEALRLIMVHEFFDRDTLAFDPRPLKQRLDQLTVPQRQLLAKYDLGGRQGRLVVFVTLRPGTDHIMYADSCTRGVRDSFYANASFTVFACRGPGETVTLACHTEYLVVNTRNCRDVNQRKAFDTINLFSQPQGGKSPDEWLSPSNLTPPRFRCAAHCAEFTDGTVWHRLFTSRGMDVMPGNSLHGMLNTKGCWMLFRNFNWPLPTERRMEFFKVYGHLRTGASEAQLRAELARLGYADRGYPEIASSSIVASYQKFFYCDRNYAYSFFLRDLLGIQFFAATSPLWKRYANMRNTHGAVFESSLPIAALMPDEYAYHDVKGRREVNPGFTPADSLWTENVLGFRAGGGFLRDDEWNNALNADRLNERCWSDWFFYKQDSWPTRKAVAFPVEPAQ